MHANQIIFYVANIPSTVKLYSELLGIEPCENHPMYACFKLDSGFILSFWAYEEVKPSVAHHQNSGFELLFQLFNKVAVDECFKHWQSKLNIIQPPESVCFGYTFTATDSDHNRLRFYADPE